MIVKEQYEFFKSVYDEHRDLTKILETRAQLYFAIQSLYFGFVVIKFSELVAGKAPWHLPSFSALFQLVVAGALLVALAFTLSAVRIRRFETACNPKQEAVMIDTNPSMDIFYARRIADFAVAAEANRLTNLSIARSLRSACWLMLAAVAAHFLFLIYSSVS